MKTFFTGFKIIMMMLAVVLVANAQQAGGRSQINLVATDRSQGNPDAKVTLIEYASLTCPHCARFHADVVKKLQKDYIEKGSIHYIYRHFPLDGTALGAALIAECIADDRKYFAFLDLLYERQEHWLASSDIKSELIKLASFAGLSSERAEECIKDRDIYDRVMGQRDLGESEFKINSTPSLIINGKRWGSDFSYSEISSYIDDVLGR